MIKQLLNLIAIFVMLFNVASVSAQISSPAPASSSAATNEPVDEVSDLKFPIEDLGGCEDYKSCSTFCDDPVNNALCIDFAKKNGFYKDDPVLAPTDDFLTKAKDVLGCESAAACATFCGEEVNYEACNAFAKSQGIPGAGYVEEIADDSVIIDKAEEDLGCSDAESCQSFCEKPENTSQCDKFADESGILGGNVLIGPGGCASNQTCANFCSDPAHYDDCKVFAAPGGTFNGPGGCDSKESCRTYCETNPDDCRSYAPGSNGVYVPAVCPKGQDFGPSGVCTEPGKSEEAAGCASAGGFWSRGGCIANFEDVPSGIHPTVGGAYYQPRPEMGNCSTPGSCFDFCKENPGKCDGNFDPNGPRPTDGYIPALYYTPGTEVKFTPKTDMGNCDSPGACYDFCKENPGKCGGFDSKAPRPVDTYMPGTYYTPPVDQRYYTPPVTGFYVTPIYFTPPAGSNYTTPTYYTPGMYSTPSYYTPFAGSNYTTPTYYSPGAYYPTPVNGQYPTPSYVTPTYYTPPTLAAYNTPTYYSPAQYITPTYYTPPAGSNYTTPPPYNTPPAYTTPRYYTPYTGGNYSTPTYYTPPAGSNYTSPSYSSPSYYYPTPTGGYTTPNYPTPPAGSTYTSPTYYTPGGTYYSPSGSYPTPSYVYPSPGGTGVSYYTPNSTYTYPSPTDGYVSPSYISPYVTPTGYSYPTPSSSYGTPESYPTPAYGTPSYGSPSYGTPEYPTPAVQGISAERTLLEQFLDFLGL